MPTGVRSARILIVEDEYLTAIDEQNRLASMGYDRVVLADSSETALESVDRDCPDLILMNINLRGPLNGLQAAELIRLRCRAAIVFVSAYPAERVGVDPADSFLRKPFTDLAFRRAVERALAPGGGASARPGAIPGLRSRNPVPA